MAPSATGRTEVQAIAAESYPVEWFTQKDKVDHPDAVYMSIDLVQRYGINTFHAERGIEYMSALHQMGIMGRGREIDCDLSFDKIKDVHFAENFLRKVAHREGLGDVLAEGFPRVAEKWGYGSILAERDSNEHGLNLRNITGALRRGAEPVVSAEELALEITSKLYPFESDMLMLDFSTENIYSMHMAKLIAWRSRSGLFPLLWCRLLCRIHEAGISILS